MTKFKFIKEDYSEYQLEDIQEYYKVVDNPLPEYQNLPQGEYLVRGNKKSHRKIYNLARGTWYLVQERTTDNGHYYCDSTKYLLFPSLSEKEWKTIRSAGWKRLNKLWQRHLAGYEHWVDLKRIGRDARKWMLEFDKEYKQKELLHVDV